MKGHAGNEGFTGVNGLDEQSLLALSTTNSCVLSRYNRYVGTNGKPDSEKIHLHCGICGLMGTMPPEQIAELSEEVEPNLLSGERCIEREGFPQSRPYTA